MVRHDHRHRVGPRLEDRQPFALAVDRGRAQHVERLEERDLGGAVKFAVIGEPPRERPRGGAPLEVAQIRAVAGAQVAGGVQFERRRSRVDQQLTRFDQVMQSLVVADAREKPDARRRARRPRRAPAVAGEVEPVRHDVHSLALDGEVLRHEVSVVAIQRDEGVDLAGPLAQQPAGLLVVGRLKLLDEDVLARQRTYDRRATVLDDHSREAEHHRIRQVHHVRLHFADQPVDELLEFLALVARFAAEHRDGHVAQFRRIDAAAAARRQAQESGVVEPAVEPPRRVAKQRNLLLQVGVDAAEEHAPLADVAFVGADGRVDRREDDVLAQLQQRGRQRVVVQTTAAVHARGAGGKVSDAHGGNIAEPSWLDIRRARRPGYIASGQDGRAI
jgi:hypothetical protein